METCACLTMNSVGEPCAGEPHARFDRGPLATPAQVTETGEKPKGQRRVPTTTTDKPAAYLTAGQRCRSVVMGCFAGADPLTRAVRLAL
jgi:hypothetical protein